MIKPPIRLDGGLCTSRHASLLLPGELTQAQDTYYMPDDVALWRAWGRTKYINSSGQIGGSSGKVIGLAYCPFEPYSEGTSADFLVAHRTDKYYTSVFSARTGTVSATTIDGVGTGTHLDAVHAANRWFLFNGNPDGVANRVLKGGSANPTSRRHGLVPVPITPTSPGVATSAGTWPTDDTFWGEGRFFFFTTEVVGPGTSDELESAASFGTPPFVDLQKDADGTIDYNVTVTRHANLANSDATEIRFYMVKASLNQAWDSSLLTQAFVVGHTSVSATYTNDKIVLTGNYAYSDPTLTPTVTTVSGSITNPTFITTPNSFPASIAAAATVDLTNWGFAVTAGDAIVGIQLWIRWRSRGLGVGVITAQFRSGAGPTLGTAKVLTESNDDYTQHVQPNSGTDTWGLTLVGTDVNSSNFGVRLAIIAVGGCTVEIDDVKIRLFTATLPSIGAAYPIVAVQEGNVLTVRSANGPPPISGTGAVVDGALIVDNVNNRRIVQYSLPNKYDYFPDIYTIGFDPEVHDDVMVIRRVGDVGIVFMRHHVFRINYVPYSTDPEFIQGRCYECVVPDHGSVSRQGVALFTLNGTSMIAAYVSDDGVRMTDGNRDHIMTSDVRWDRLVDVTKLDKAVLTNYPTKSILAMQYVGYGTAGSENNREILIHYHPSHRKENGHYKITGPNLLSVSCATIARLTSEKVFIVGHATDARLYVEDNDVTDAAGVGINVQFETAELYAAGIGLEATVIRSWLHQNGAGVSMSGTLTPYYRLPGVALASTTAQTFVPSVEGALLLQTHFGLVETVRYRVALPDAGASNAAVAFNHIVHDVNAHGKVSNG